MCSRMGTSAQAWTLSRTTQPKQANDSGTRRSSPLRANCSWLDTCPCAPIATAPNASLKVVSKSIVRCAHERAQVSSMVRRRREFFSMQCQTKHRARNKPHRITYPRSMAKVARSQTIAMATNAPLPFASGPTLAKMTTNRITSYSSFAWSSHVELRDSHDAHRYRLDR
jgi:hypothetical protein